MTGSLHRGRPDAVEVTTDDQLLDALSRGESPTPGDVAAHLLAAWRERLPGSSVGGMHRPTGGLLWSPVTSKPGRPRSNPARARRRQAALAGAAAGMLAVVAGAGVAATSRAEPGSPLWPVTELVFAQRAQARLAQWDAERAIQDARTALADGRYADVHRNLDLADRLLDQVHPSARARLRAEIEAIRRALPKPRVVVDSPGQPVITPPTPSSVPREPAPAGLRGGSPAQLQHPTDPAEQHAGQAPGGTARGPLRDGEAAREANQ